MGVLHPPTHPERNYCVEVDGRRITLTTALRCGDAVLCPSLTQQIASLFADYQPVAIETQEVQEWISRVLWFFHHCYIDCDEEIDGDRDPIMYADSHAGVVFIRKFYPNFKPTREHFNESAS
jgi:hypothetical protein